MNILYITIKSTNDNGGHYVSERNFMTLKQIYGERNIHLHQIKFSIFSIALSLLSFSSYGVSRKHENKIIKSIIKRKYDIVFFDTSILGNLVAKCNKNNIKTIVFAHNVDTILYLQRVINHLNLINFIKYFFIRSNEKKTFINATSIIALTNRDAAAMVTCFFRSPDIILPITFPVKKLSELTAKININCKPYCLFVGSNFFPNIAGIKWFILNVAPYIVLDVHIVGSCCDNSELKQLILPKNVHLNGFVDDLDSWYINASCIIIPIFQGSGMKTKTVEAMSYGKNIVGTTEAFVGVECDYDRIGGLCNSKDEFIKCLNNNNFNFINEYVLTLFNEKYTNDYFENGIRKIF